MPDSLDTTLADLGSGLKADENSPSPTTENTIDALTDVADDEEHPKHDQHIETIAKAAERLLPDNVTAEVQDTRSDFIERLMEVLKEQLVDRTGETVTQEFIDALVDAVEDGLI